MKPITLGTFNLGCMTVVLSASTGRGGDFTGQPNGILAMSVGCDGAWPQTVAALLHEAMEAALMELGCRYGPSPDYALSSANYLLVANHEQFAEAIARAAEFLVPTLPELATAYKRLHPKEGK